MASKQPEPGLALKNFRPKLKIDPLVRPIHRFMEVESSGGLILLLATILALFLANTSLASWYNGVWTSKISLSFAGQSFELTLLEFINDGLMTLFFFVVGLEIKREITFGELRSLKRALFPLIGAVGGMLAPALIYFFLQRKSVGLSGWAIPMATDIAFVVGFLSLLGKRVPYTLKITLLTLAIADDIGAILVIGLAYAHGFSREFFLAGLGFYALIFLLNFLGVRKILPYIVLGFAMWLCIYRSGVHPTIAGVLLGLAAPAKRLLSPDALRDFLARFQDSVKDETLENPVERENLRAAARESLSPLERLETDLHPYVSFLIMPLFALANAGVPIEITALESRVAWAVILGLVIGKPLGIVGAAWIVHAVRWLPLPRGVNFPVYLGAGCLCGVGFTMSIFISGLALEGDLLVAAKTGVLLGSAISSVLGLFLLHKFLARRELDNGET